MMSTQVLSRGLWAFLLLASTASAQQTTPGHPANEESFTTSFPRNSTPASELVTDLTENGLAGTSKSAVTNSTSITSKGGDASDPSTSGIPDVTATSQRIILQRTGLPDGAGADQRSESATTTAETIERSTVAPSATSTGTDSPVLAKETSVASLVTRTSLSPTATATLATATPTSTNALPTTSVATTTSETATEAPEKTNTTTFQEEKPTPVPSEGNGTAERTVLLTFSGKCDYDSASVIGLTNDAGAAVVSCEEDVRLRLSVLNVSGLDRLVGAVRLRTRGSFLTLSSVDLMDEWVAEAEGGNQGFFPRLFSGPISTREVITYAVVGAVFGVAIVLVAALLCCKCCCGQRRRKKSEDIPHLTLRLEDYSLTRIPRPNTLFGVGAAVRNGHTPDGSGSGMRQSIDTSVVPIEEDFGSIRRTGLRSFSGRRRGNRATDRERDEDQDEARSRCSPALTGSTERLARDFGNRQPKKGNDNKNFRF